MGWFLYRLHCHGRRHCHRRLAFLRKGNATSTARLALLVGGYILVCKLEDLLIGARDGVGSREGIVVDLLLEVPVRFVAEAMEEKSGKVVALRLSCYCLVFSQNACFSQSKHGCWAIDKDNLGRSQV